MSKKLTVIEGERESGNGPDHRDHLDMLASDSLPLERAIHLRLARKVHELGAHFDPATEAFTCSRGVYTSDEIANLAWLEKSDWPSKAFQIGASELVRTMRLEAVSRIKANMLKSDSEGASDSDVPERAALELKAFIKLMAHASASSEELLYYEIAWRQLIWQVKRKLRGLPTSWEMMLCLYSRQGTGKSSVVAKFGKPLRQLFMPMADFNLFSDKFRLPQLHTHYLVCLDEMGRARKTDINTIKQIITSDTIQSRKIYSQSEIALTRNASFIATTNRPLMAQLSDPSGMRRFVEMRCSDNAVSEAWIKSIDKIDFNLLWQCESGSKTSDAPTAAHRALFTKFQQRVASISDFEYWAEHSLLVTTSEADKIKNIDAYSHYRDHCESQRHRPVSIQLFAREMRERYGIAKVHNAVYFSGLKLTQRED